MVNFRVDRYVGRISEALRGAVAEDRTPRETAGSFALGSLLLGNLILAAVATAIGYVGVHRLAVAYRKSEVGTIIEETAEEIVEETVDH